MDHESEYVFHNIEDIVIFVQWIKDNFENIDDYENWFGGSMEYLIPPEVVCTRQHKDSPPYFSCKKCKAKFSTAAGLSIHDSILHKGVKSTKDDAEFWKIINEEYKDNGNEHKQSTDQDSISDTD